MEHDIRLEVLYRCSHRASKDGKVTSVSSMSPTADEEDPLLLQSPGVDCKF